MHTACDCSCKGSESCIAEAITANVGGFEFAQRRGWPRFETFSCWRTPSDPFGPLRTPADPLDPFGPFRIRLMRTPAATDARAHRSRVVAAARSSQNDARRFRRGE